MRTDDWEHWVTAEVWAKLNLVKRWALNPQPKLFKEGHSELIANSRALNLEGKVIPSHDLPSPAKEIGQLIHSKLK
jgi:hypothetical protein